MNNLKAIAASAEQIVKMVKNALEFDRERSEAEKSGKILLFDEADTFLFNRESARFAFFSKKSEKIYQNF